MNKLRIGIDATNLRRGGGRTHLIEFLRAIDGMRDQFDSVIVWGSRQTLDLLIDASWLDKAIVPTLEKGLVRRTLWQRFSLNKVVLMADCNVLFVPGGNFLTRFRPIVTMSRNMLPFEWHELRRYGVSLMTLKLLLLRFTQGYSFRKASGVIFLTNYAKKNVLRAIGKLSGSTKVIPHGLNPRFLSSDGLAARKLPNKGESIRLIYVSIIDQYKHQWHVVEAVAKVRRSSGLDLQLDLIGPSSASALTKLRASFLQNDLQNEWAHYRGAVDYQELDSLYAKAHVGIFASSCENMPNILLEMMGAGLPVLSSDRGPMPEILGDAGLYFDPENPESLATVLLEFLHSNEKIKTFGHAAHQKAKVYSWERCADDTLGFLRHVAEVEGASKEVELGR